MLARYAATGDYSELEVSRQCGGGDGMLLCIHTDEVSWVWVWVCAECRVCSLCGISVLESRGTTCVTVWRVTAPTGIDADSVSL